MATERPLPSPAHVALLPIICTIEDRIALANVAQACECVDLATVEPGNERMWARHADLGPTIVDGVLVDSGPLALGPETTLHLATFCHLETVQRVAVRTEEASDEVVTTAELTTLGVEFLPPVLMVTMRDLDVLLVATSAFAWFLALAQVDIVQSIATTVRAEAGHEEVGRAYRPAPLVKRARPIHELAVFATDALTVLAVVGVTAILAHTFATIAVAVAMVLGAL